MDKVFHCHSSLSDLPDLGEKLVGTDCGSFHFRCLHYQENPLVILEEVKEPDCPKRNELGRCHRFRFGSGIFREHLYLSELSDPILLTGKIIAGGRLPVCKQDELWSPCTEYSAIDAIGTAYTADTEHQVVH